MQSHNRLTDGVPPFFSSIPPSLTFLSGYFVGELLKLGHEKAVHVVGVRIKPLAEIRRRMEALLAEVGETSGAKVQT